MGYKEIELKVPLQITENELQEIIKKKLNTNDFVYNIVRKSLDARNKKNIYWQYKIGLSSKSIEHGEIPDIPTIDIPNKKYKSRAVVVGSGPAGIFSALVLSMSGMHTTLIEQGDDVDKRKNSIHEFESSGILSEEGNYAFGEGGAGTFSDGKLTSRTKNISREKNFIFKHFIEAGAPKEIMYLTHPHLGSDNLIHITRNLRKKFLDNGGKIHFNTKLTDIRLLNNKVLKAITNTGEIDSDFLIIAPGHSSYSTYKLLISKGVGFQTKNFAIGMRAEHQQETINRAQWGCSKLPGVKAAEYRLTAKADKPVYSFCMCPGGVVVPATPYKNTNIVNGMSLYKRGNKYANAAVVVGIHPDELVGKVASPIEAIEWLEQLETTFYNYSNSYDAPSIKILDFLNNRQSNKLPDSSYPFNLVPADIGELLPSSIVNQLRIGLKSFSHKLKGYEDGTLIGLESKTSSPIQVLRDHKTLFSSIENLILAGEGSGWAGGIMSSAADGVRAAMSILATAK